MKLPTIYPTAKDWIDADLALGLPDDAEIATLARRVNAARKGSGERLVSESAVRAREMGFLGQRAVCRALSLPGNFQVMKRGTRRAPIRNAQNVPIGVVTRSPLPGGRCPDLIVRVKEQARYDLALVLVVWLGPEYEPVIPGWLWEANLRDIARIDTFRGEANYVVSPSAMQSIQTLSRATPYRAPERVEQIGFTLEMAPEGVSP